ncbi:MAG TPA: alpha/beta hydrolase [Acidimicrobiales bacterium]|nr:alpha/beta hydrolase [Acidimicrobiales bacterium]
MATYVLVHGWEHSSWYWHLVIAELEALGHEALAADLPCDDDDAGLDEYADTVVEGAGGRRGVVLVGHSLAGFSVPLACQRLEAPLMVLVAAMVPRPGETAGEWWANTGYEFPEPFDPASVFAHDLPPGLAAQLPLHIRRHSGSSSSVRSCRPAPEARRLPSLAPSNDEVAKILLAQLDGQPKQWEDFGTHKGPVRAPTP